MTRHFGDAANSSNSISTTPQFDDFIGVTQFSHGADAPPAIGDAINTDNSIGNTDHAVGNTGFSTIEDLPNASGNNADQSTTEDSTTASGDDQANDQQYLVASSAVDSAGLPGKNDDKIVESYSSVGDGIQNNHLTGIFDHTDNLNFFDHIDNLNFGQPDNSSGFANSPFSGASSSMTFIPPFEPPGMDSAGAPDVSSAAKGHGGGGSGGSGSGGTTPASYTTNSTTGVNIHVTYDSSVGSAPAGFTSVVQKVADFFASSFQDSTPITINIDVGYGEVDGMRLSFGAIGESVTNLQQVSYSQLTSAYSASGLSLGSSIPSGNLYVSYAEAKALNISITSPLAVDGYVGFGSQNFDYNNADGVSSNQYDFYGVVAHEFSEVMGRILLVGGNINNAPSYTAYDLFHYSSPGVQDFSGNGGYFSNDQGTTNLATFNNPSNGGDAGDWANTGTSKSGGSIYDAFNAFDTTGHVEPVSHTDLLALQALGYHLV